MPVDCTAQVWPRRSWGSAVCSIYRHLTEESRRAALRPMYQYQPQTDFLAGLLLVIILGVGGALSLQLTVNNRDRMLWQMRIYLIALFMRFAASTVIYEFGLMDILGDEDASGWYGGVVLLKKWVTKNVGFLDLPTVMWGAFDTSGGKHLGYPYMLALFFYVTDTPSRMPAAALNCFFGAMTVVFVYRIARMLFSLWVAERAAWLACFFPSLIIWSALTVKEPLVILLETIALYACLRLKDSGFSLGPLIVCGVAIVLLIPFRFYASYIVAVAAGLALLMPQFKKRKSTVLTGVTLSAVLLGVVVWSGIWARSEATVESVRYQSG